MSDPARGPSDSDIRELAARGIEPAEYRRQLELLRSPPNAIRLLRPATIGDGILRLSPEQAETRARAAERVFESRELVRFVPASGAASRMFQSLSATGAQTNQDAARNQSLAEFLDKLGAWPFQEEINRALARNGLSSRALAPGQGTEELIHQLFSPSHGSLAALPKGLVPFHRIGKQSFTAFDEHLYEAATLAGAGNTACVHFTVLSEHRPAFEAHLSDAGHKIEEQTGTRLRVEFSEQLPSTDTLCLDEDSPARDKRGQLLLRPGGHGALISNLSQISGALVVLKNIDNIAPHNRQELSVQVLRELIGFTVLLREEIFQIIRGLDRQPERIPEEAGRWLQERLSHTLSSASDARRFLDRPLRVCGVVANQGEPGGGPFWVLTGEQATPQIVEGAQIEKSDTGQRRILESATHFNPVIMVCNLESPSGRRYDLASHVDPTTSFVTRKRDGGRELTVLERPGLWNGAMADWTTVFVEIPVHVFTPVKELWDLLRPEHRTRQP